MPYLPGVVGLLPVAGDEKEIQVAVAIQVGKDGRMVDLVVPAQVPGPDHAPVGALEHAQGVVVRAKGQVQPAVAIPIGDRRAAKDRAPCRVAPLQSCGM